MTDRGPTGMYAGDNRSYQQVLIKLQPDQRADGRWVPRCSLLYARPDGKADTHKIVLEDKSSAPTRELAAELAFQAAKNWIEANRGTFGDSIRAAKPER